MEALPCAIVLSRPEESRNIGSVCRAMMNMDCYDLRIVGNRDDYSENQIKTLALHAFPLWESAVFFEPSVKGLREAVADCSIAAGTTRRMGQKRKSWGMTPEQFARTVRENSFSKAAIVFGNERTGLTDEELDCCSVALNIPSSKKFGSLNLSHAVQIITYTLFCILDERKRGYEPISLSRVQTMTDSVCGYIDRLGLYKKAGGEENRNFLESVFARTALSEREAQRLEKLFKRMAFIRRDGE
ncbi:RNA methyltransferase [Brucepastera parasyntrophica]|uniref:RNA methyltransferase n=1 Tax=Brucepastera parasyntrophica TaxID=2880008 RepID=UPI00210A28BA|nr:RNA methyltransferase [Brucepastera parasyntrophica]ULQ60888.1 RNA methyltransferase [Brucepastera parasyntrophica]